MRSNVAPEGAETAAPRERGARPALPCLNSNNCTEPPLPDTLQDGLRRLTTNHRKTAFNLARAVARLCGRYGIERVGFLTLTFADHVTCAREAGKRLHSLTTHVLSERYAETICVLERMQSGRIHFHLLVVLDSDIRTGFDFAQASEGDYSSANGALRGEWSFWRRTAKSYGFGRTELLPVKSSAEGLSKYVGKYIAKHVGKREDRDRGVRLVRYSRGASVGTNAFMFRSPRSRLWRWQAMTWAARNGCTDLDEVREKFGARWAYSHRHDITAIEPPCIEVAQTEDGDALTLWDVWMSDRLKLCAAVAASMGLGPDEVYAALFQSGGSRLDFTVKPCVHREPPAVDFSDEGDVTVIWNAPPDDEGAGVQVGRVERVARDGEAAVRASKGR